MGAFKHSRYRWYWASGMGMAGAQGINQITLPWLVLDLTGSVGQLGLVIFVQGVPMAIMALFGGVLADRYSRRSVLMWTQAVTTINFAVLALLTLSGLVEIWNIYLTAIILGLASSITMPARNALIRSLVPVEDTMNAVALNSMQQQASRILWPSLAGALIALFGVGTTISISALCSLLGILCLQILRGLQEEKLARGASAFKEMLEGVHYTFTTPRLSMVMTLALAIGAFGLAYMSMGPAFARLELGFSASMTGLFMMASGVGALLGSLLLLVINVRDQHRFFVFWCFAFGASLIALTLNPWPAIAFVCMALFGISTTGLSITGQAIFQLTVPPRLLGRVSSLWMVGGGLGSITALPIGLVGDEFGLRWALGGVAVMLLVVTAWIGVVRYARPVAVTPEARLK